MLLLCLEIPGKTFFIMFELMEIMRQKGDFEFLQLLNILRLNIYEGHFLCS